jgi:hypothetical protein
MRHIKESHSSARTDHEAEFTYPEDATADTLLLKKFINLLVGKMAGR